MIEGTIEISTAALGERNNHEFNNALVETIRDLSVDYPVIIQDTGADWMRFEVYDANSDADAFVSNVLNYNIYQLAYPVEDIEDPDAVFNAIQNEFGLHDNAVLETGHDVEYKNRIVIEGDNYPAMRTLDGLIKDTVGVNLDVELNSQIQTAGLDDRIATPGDEADYGPLNTRYTEKYPGWALRMDPEKYRDLREAVIQRETSRKQQEIDNDPKYARKEAEQKIRDNPHLIEQAVRQEGEVGGYFLEERASGNGGYHMRPAPDDEASGQTESGLSH